MNPLKKSTVKQKRDALKPTNNIPQEKPANQSEPIKPDADESGTDKSGTGKPVSHHKRDLAKKYDSSGVDKHGYKTEPSPNSTYSIKFKPQNGMPFGFPYAYLQTWYFEDENTSLFLVYSQGIVKITGTNLDPLFDQINQYKVKEIYVTDISDAPKNQTSIESILVKRNMEIEL